MTLALGVFMHPFFDFIVRHAKGLLLLLIGLATFGFFTWQRLAVDVFPDVSMPRVTIQTEAGGLTAEEVEQLVTIPIESAVNGIPGVRTIRSSSSGGLSFVWVDFDWNVPLTQARFDVFERLSRVQALLPEEAHAEMSPVVSVTGEILLVALTTKDATQCSPLELREMAEFDLRYRLLAVPGISEVVVIGGKLPEVRVAIDGPRLAEAQLSVFDLIEAVENSRTFLSAGYLANIRSEEIPLRQIARADTLEALRNVPLPLAKENGLRLGDVANLTIAGMPRRGSASYNGQEAVILSIQKAPGGNTPKLTQSIDHILNDFAASVAEKGIDVHPDAYRQSDFIHASIEGGKKVVYDAILIVIGVLLLTLLEVRTMLIVLCAIPFSILSGLVFFPLFDLGINVMTLGGIAVATGDIVDATIIFTEVIRRKLHENLALPESERLPRLQVILMAVRSVSSSVLFSTFIVVLVFLPLLCLSGLEGRFFQPLALSYLSVFAMSLLCAWILSPALAQLLRLAHRTPTKQQQLKQPLSVRLLHTLYRPFLRLVLRLPILTLLIALFATGSAVYLASSFGSSFLPAFQEDSFNVMLSLPPGASLEETERISEACVPVISQIPGVLSVTRRTGRAERDQHAEPVSSSEFVVRIDLKKDTNAIRDAIRHSLMPLPGCAVAVSTPIAHRISAVLSGTEAELAVNVYGESLPVLRETVAKMKEVLETLPEVTDVRANREITVRTLRIVYDPEALREAGITLKEAGEQVAAAFNGIEAGEIREGVRRRAITIRLPLEEIHDIDTLKALLLSGRNATRRVRLDQVAHIFPEEASNLMLREGGRRKALISCNPATGVDVGHVVKRLLDTLTPIANAAGCSIDIGGSYQARESAAQRLTLLGIGLLIVIFFILFVAIGTIRAALLALINILLSLIGAVIAIWLTVPIVSVSSLIGFITVIGFVLRNGILLLTCYRNRVQAGETLDQAIRQGSEERMVPIVMTSLTTVIGLIPIMLAADTSGGELLAPLAVVQFGGLLGAMLLNLLILPAAVKCFGLGMKGTK